MRKQLMFFVIRWLMISLGLWVATRLLSNSFHDTDASLATFLIAGLVLSLVNTVLKPVIVVLSLPAILVTLGLFTLILNAAMVALTIWIMPDVTMTFWGAIESCLLISLINFLVNLVVPDVK